MNIQLSSLEDRVNAGECYAPKLETKCCSTHKKKQKLKITSWKRLAVWDLERHPALSSRKPEATSVKRVMGFNTEAVEHFYGNLDEVMSKHKLQATIIYNIDELGINIVHFPPNLLVTKALSKLPP
ncbi:hypothetical protein PR048_016372 [Dryococelus australis]|uniref:Uncharacterized protein n=1 Tax=Dryococelus australis TaxID=614101 RepID=A0ABQ9HK04_9NEOP|nr:hypothetical protein PR048_016372 [Dryococelus australis]